MQGQTTQANQKIIESVERSTSLLTEKKYYEFAQKIKSLAQRKSQTGKHEEAELLLHLGVEKMLGIEQTEFNAIHELFLFLFELYEKQRTLWKEDTSGKLLRLFKMRENPRKIEYELKVIGSLCKIEACPDIAEDLISDFERRELFLLAEPHVVPQNLQRVGVFLKNWKTKLTEEEYFCVVSRMALLKGFFFNFDESMVLLSEVPAHDPFVKFARFLIQSVQLKAVSCYDKIGSKYQKFLQSDASFNSLYQMYGVKFFKKEKKSNGLGGLFS